MGDLLLKAEAIPSEAVRQSGVTEVSRGHSTEEAVETRWREGLNFQSGEVLPGVQRAKKKEREKKQLLRAEK